MTVAAGIAVTCGGQIFDGYFDPQGNYHDKDGAVVFGPGTSCEGYDASALASTAGQWEKGSVYPDLGACDADAYCKAALPAGLTFPTPFSATSTDKFYIVGCVPNGFAADAGGICSAGADSPPACPGENEDGNHYCQTFYQQFVAAPGARALASCKRCRDLQPKRAVCAGDYICVPDCCNGAGFCVQRGNAAAGCEYPCKP